MSEEPALLKWRTCAHPGVSWLARCRSKAMMVMLLGIVLVVNVLFLFHHKCKNPPVKNGSLHLPHLYCLVPGAGGDVLAVGRPGNGANPVGVTGESVERAPGDSVQDLDCFIEAGRSNV